MRLTLLDMLAYRMGCAYLSDLQFLSAWQYVRLAREVEQIMPEEIPLQEWNDALHYLTGASSEDTPERARNMLLDLLACRDQESDRMEG